MNTALPRLLVTIVALSVLALALVVGTWYASKRAGGVGATLLWAGTTAAFAAYMIWRTYQVAATAGPRPPIGLLPGTLYVALAMGVMAFAPTTWYVWRQQRGGKQLLSRDLVLRGVGVFVLGFLALLCAALVLDVTRMSGR